MSSWLPLRLCAVRTDGEGARAVRRQRMLRPRARVWRPTERLEKAYSGWRAALATAPASSFRT